MRLRSGPCLALVFVLGATSVSATSVPTVERTFVLENASVAEVTTALRAVAGISRLTTLESSRVVIAESPERVARAAALVAEIDVPRPQVDLEIRVLEIADGALVDRAGADGDVLRFSSARLEALEAAGARRLATLRGSSIEGETLRIVRGERVPLAAGADEITYQETGFRVRATPRVHPESRDVTLRFTLDLAHPASSSSTPHVRDRHIEGSARLSEGESLVLPGLVPSGPGPFGEIADDPAREVVLILQPIARLPETSPARTAVAGSATEAARSR